MKHHGLYQSAHASRETNRPSRVGGKEPKVSPYPSSPPASSKRQAKSSYRKGHGYNDDDAMHKGNQDMGDDDGAGYVGGGVNNVKSETFESGGIGGGEEVKMEDGMMGMMMVKSEPMAHEQQHQGVPDFHDMGAYQAAAGYQLEQHGVGAGGFHEEGVNGGSDGGLVFSEFLQPGTFEEGPQQGGGGYEMVGQNVFVVD